MIKNKYTKLVAAMGITLFAGAAQAAYMNIAVNGDFETGDFTGWTLDPDLPGSESISTVNNGGSYSGLLNATGAQFTFIKNANLAAGLLSPNQQVDISFDLYGSVGPGGVVFAEFFSELSGGGTSKSEILGGGGPLFPNSTWTTYSYSTTTGADVSGGVTLLLKVDCGANSACVSDAYFDNVTISTDVSAVPVPAAVWLFGSGLLGLIGVARRKAAA